MIRADFKLIVILASVLAVAAVAACADEDGEPGSAAETVAEEAASSRLDAVWARGRLVCAAVTDTPGFGALDETGNTTGFDIDLCRAVAAAVLGDPDAIDLRMLTASERGPILQSGEVDMLVFVTTWTTSRDTYWGNFVQTMFYDGQGFMVQASLGVDSSYDLGGASVCVTSGTTTELNMADFFRQNDLEYDPRVFEESGVALESYESGACDAFTSDRSALTAVRTTLPNPQDHVILPETISEEPLGPVVPHGDEQWFDIVKAVMGMLIYAEAYGVHSGNVDAMAVSDNVKVKRLLGTEGSYGQEGLGLDETVAQTVIRAVGNYGQIYNRHLGPGGIDLPREGSRNALWADAPCAGCPKGGQIYAAPFR